MDLINHSREDRVEVTRTHRCEFSLLQPLWFDNNNAELGRGGHMSWFSARSSRAGMWMVVDEECEFTHTTQHIICALTVLPLYSHQSR